jgi:uncharacterized protein YecT (DUF1311 family)
MRALLSIVVCLAMFGGSAAAASFDCKKAKTKAEKLICATPELSRADEELAREYKAARGATKNAKGLREAQATWLRRRRDACADAACMLAAYKRRMVELRATARPIGRTGTYEHDGSSIDILEIAPGVLRFYISAIWSGKETVHTGDLCGDIKVEANKAKYVRKEDGKECSPESWVTCCELTWTFREDGNLTIQQEGGCDFGANVTASGTYEKSSSDAPSLQFCLEYE